MKETEKKELEAEELKKAAGGDFLGLPYTPPKLPKKPDDKPRGGGATGGW